MSHELNSFMNSFYKDTMVYHYYHEDGCIIEYGSRCKSKHPKRYNRMKHEREQLFQGVCKILKRLSECDSLKPLFKR